MCLLSLAFHIGSENNLNDYGYADNDKRNNRIFRFLRIDNLLYRLNSRRNTGIDNQRCHNHGCDIFDSAVPQRMFFIRFPVCKLGSDNGDYRGDRIRKVIYGIECYGNRMAE